MRTSEVILATSDKVGEAKVTNPAVLLKLTVFSLIIIVTCCIGWKDMEFVPTGESATE